MKDFIKKWYNDNNIEEQTLGYFWKSFDIYLKDDFEESIIVFPEGNKNIVLKFYKISYEFELPDLLTSDAQGLIGVYIDIFTNGKNVGYFRQLYLLDGTPFDEYFVINEIKC